MHSLPLSHFPSFNADLHCSAYAVRSYSGKMFGFFFFLSPENLLIESINTGRIESCRTCTCAPAYPVADGLAHPQLLVTLSGRSGVWCGALRPHMTQMCSLPFFPLAKEEDTLCAYQLEQLWLVLKLLDIKYTFVFIL